MAGKKSMALGGGGRFQAGVDKMTAKGMPPTEAKAIMAKQGRAKLGKAEFQALAAAGKKRARGSK